MTQQATQPTAPKVRLAFTVNGRALDEYFGRPTLRTTATSPLELTGLRDRFDVRALCDGGGVTGQAGALRHGIARLALDHIDLLVVYGLHSCHRNLRVSILPVDHTRGIKNRDSLG